jgi:hypothetical protein
VSVCVCVHIYTYIYTHIHIGMGASEDSDSAAEAHQAQQSLASGMLMILGVSFACILGLFCLYSRSLLTLVHTSGMPVSVGLFCSVIGLFLGLF